MRRGRRIAIDVGKVRIGLAVSDLDAILASPLTTVSRNPDIEQTVDAIVAEISEYQPIEIYVGLPINLKGDPTASTEDAIHLAKQISSRVECDVRLIDERLSTVAAAQALRSSGRNTKSSRGVIDQVAATIILESAMDFERNFGKAPGRSIGEENE